MSHSRFEDYSKCGELYRLKRVEKVPRTPSIFAAAGTAFHEWTDWWDQETDHPPFVDEGWYQNRLTQLVAELQEESGFSLAEWDTPDKSKGSNQKHFDRFLNEHGPDWIQKYAAWREETGWEVAEMYEDGDGTMVPGIEFPLCFTAGAVEVIAVVDRIFETSLEGDLVAIDTKTWSKRRVTPQLPTYLVGLRKMGFNVTGAAYYEARRGTHTPVETYRFWDEQRLAALHERAARGIEAQFFVPNPGEACGMCDVKRHCIYQL